MLLTAQEIWNDLGRGMRAGLLAVAALILLGVGGSVRSHSEPALRRLNSFLWFISVAAAGWAIGIAADDPGPDDYQVTLVAGVGTAIYGLVLWSFRRTAAQQLAVFLGMLMSTQGVVGTVADDSSLALTIAHCAAGFGWMLLGRARWMTPVGAALVFGGIAALLGAQATFFVDNAVGLYLGILTAAIIVATSVAFRHTALLVIGVAGMFVFVTEGVFEYLGDSIGAGAALFVSGLLLLVAALALARMRSLIRSPDAADASGPSRTGGWP